MHAKNSFIICCSVIQEMQVSQKSIGYVVSAVFCVYALVYKVPIPCMACESGSFWSRCIKGTGANTASCSAHKAAKDRVDKASNIMDQAGVYMDNLWDFTKTELPETISEFIATLKDQILGLKDRMSAKIGLIITFLREKLCCSCQRSRRLRCRRMRSTWRM